MLYTDHNLHPAYRLRYGWCAWPAENTFPPEPPLEALVSAWESDGLRLLEHTWHPKQIKMTFSVRPDVSPVLFTQRTKGRLQHHLRQAGTPVKFSRKVTMRTLGENTRETVEHYIAEQTQHADFADPRFATLLDEYKVDDPAVNLSAPAESNSGRYWFNLHLVLVVADRFRFGERAVFKKMRDGALAVAEAKGYDISRLSVMPDHLHVALRGSIQHAPTEIGLNFQNGLAEAMGRFRVWETGFYVGSFSEYGLDAVRRPRA